MSKLPTLPGSTAATVQKDSGKPTKDDYNWRIQLDGLLRKNSFLANVGTANQILVSDGSNPGYEDLTALLDALFGTAEGAIIARGASAWAKLDPADGYLKNTSGVLSWGAVTAPPQWELIEARSASLSASTEFWGLDSYQSVIVMGRAIGLSVASGIILRASIDGTNWLTGSGDYYPTSGYILIGGGSPGTYQLMAAKIHCLLAAAPKLVDVQYNGAGATAATVESTSPIKGLAIQTVSAVAPTGGTFYLYGLPKP